MKLTAIISEYNPFHNGHKFQINMIKMNDDSHFVVAIMSGNFTQRGEPAVLDKWARARLALLGGADIVIELPALFALQSAEGFASGGVAVANGLGVVDELCFGSESADMDKLRQAARVLASEDARFRSSLKNSLSKGVSFPAARTAALNDALGGDAEILNHPNDILAVEYLKALIRTESFILPKAIKRAGASYTDPIISGRIASALLIRGALKKGDAQAAFTAIPPSVHGFLNECLSENRPVFPEYFFDLLIYKLRSMTESEISAIAGVAEGLQHKIKKSAAAAANYHGLLAGVKSKRYTQTRLSRIFMCCLLGITQKMQEEANTYEGIYARVLGYRSDALPAFSRLCKESRIPVLTAGTQLPDHILSRIDIHASDVYSLACADRTAGKDFTQKLIVE
jgi:predicted nucleotidyltransferase